jgi:5-(carboxyamino)imidazole ribonucleotide mutase
MVGIIMGSQSDLPIMQQAADFLKSLEIPYELTVVSAHRTKRMFDYAKSAKNRGIKVIIAGAGGACAFTRNGGELYYFACDWCAYFEQ